MVYINIPYVPENNRIDKNLTKKEIQALDISEDAKYNVYAAIYNLKPRGIDFDDKDLAAAISLESALRRLGVPFRRSEESEY